MNNDNINNPDHDVTSTLRCVLAVIDCNNHNETHLWSKCFPTWCNQFYLSSRLANQKKLC